MNVATRSFQFLTIPSSEDCCLALYLKEQIEDEVREKPSTIILMIAFCLVEPLKWVYSLFCLRLTGMRAPPDTP
jgi:hypothetical protein